MFLRKFICILFLAGLCSVRSQAQSLDSMEVQLMVYADSMYLSPIPDFRPGYAEQLAKGLVRMLRSPDSYNFPFKRLGTKINILSPPDNSFRIFNWGVYNTNLSQRYYGAIQMNTPDLKLYGLVDHSADMKREDELAVLKPSNWFGCLYYNVLEKTVDGEKVYTLLGLNRSRVNANRKVMDALRFTEGGPEFGAPVFRIRDEGGRYTTQNRFLLEYKRSVQASLNWDPEQNAIFFDRLISETNDPNRRNTFVPTGQYDGFRWNGNAWDMVQDLIRIEVLKDGQAPDASGNPTNRGR